MGSCGSADVSVQPLGQPIMKRLAIWYRIERHRGFSRSGMLLTPRAPLNCCRGGVWLDGECLKHLVEAVVAGLRLRHCAGSHEGGWLLPVIGRVQGVAAVKQRGQS